MLTLKQGMNDPLRISHCDKPANNQMADKKADGRFHRNRGVRQLHCRKPQKFFKVFHDIMVPRPFSAALAKYLEPRPVGCFADQVALA